MTDAAFNVLATLDELKTAGFNETQARALTHGLQTAVSARQNELATKFDLAERELRLTKIIADQQPWTIGVMVVLPSILFAAIKLV